MSESEQERRATITLADAVAAFRTTHRLENVLRPLRISLRAVSVLAFFADRPDAGLHEAIPYFGLSKSAVTMEIDHLERCGWARRRRRRAEGALTRRNVTVELTDVGRDLLASLAVIEMEQGEAT